jgi:hypothetical protein
LLHPFLTSSKLGPRRKEGYLASRRFTRQAGGQPPHQVQAGVFRMHREVPLP